MSEAPPTHACSVSTLPFTLEVPWGICADRDGVIYVVEAGKGRIVKIMPDCADAPIVLADGLLGPTCLAHDGNQALYVGCTHAICCISCTDGSLTTVAGALLTSGYVDGPAAQARFNKVRGMAVDRDGNIYAADLINNAVRMVSADGLVTTVAGGPDKGVFKGPCAVELGKDGQLLVLDYALHQLLKIHRISHVVSVVAGSHTGFADGTALDARFSSPQGFALDGDGNALIADRGNHRLRMLQMPSGVCTALAGTGIAGEVDGTGLVAQFSGVLCVTILPNGDAAVTDHVIKKVRIVKAGLQPPVWFTQAYVSTKSTFCTDMLLALSEDDLADVTFNVSGRRFKAHRLILSVRCDAFRSMLSSGMIESSSRCVDITDTTPEAFCCFLKYLYADVLPLGLKQNAAAAAEAVAAGAVGACAVAFAPADQMIADLLLLARKYMVPRLFKLCCDHIRHSVCCANALAVLVWTEDHVVEELAPAVRRFVVQHGHEIWRQQPGPLQVLEGRSQLLLLLLKDVFRP